MKTYEKYKDSGIEWIGEIPEHWETNKFNRIAFYQEGPGLRNWQFTTSGIKVICVTNIVPPIIDFSNFQKYISEQEYNDSYQHFTVSKGDLLLASSGASWGKVSVYEDSETVILNTSTIRLNENQTQLVARNFIKWIIQSPYVFEQLNILLTGSCQPNFGPSHLSQLRCAYPKEISEQLIISSYLDFKTAEIDRIIANKQKLIALYEEEKQAIINQAVTKGLDPTVKLKDSGVEWLGEIPEHWEQKNLKYLARVQTGGTPKIQNAKMDYFAEGNINWYTPSDFYNDGVLEDSKRKINDFAVEDGEVEIFSEDSVFLVSIGATLGKVGLSKTKASANQQINVIIFDKSQVNPFYGYYFLVSNKEMIKLEADYTTLPILNQTKTKSLTIAYPDLKEQDKIVQYIDNECGRINTILGKFNKQIDLLQEYRTTLISDVVTGKIKVID